MKNIAKKMSKRLNYLREEVVLDYYYEFLKMILADLRDNDEFELPDFGTFKVLKTKSRKMRNINSGNYIILPESRIVKFYPHRKLKEYFKNLVK